MSEDWDRIIIDELEARLPARLVAADIGSRSGDGIWIVTASGEHLDYDPDKHQLWLER